jgi:hypothetical protein
MINTNAGYNPALFSKEFRFTERHSQQKICGLFKKQT